MARALTVAETDARGWYLMSVSSNSVRFHRLRKDGFYAGCATLEELLHKCNQINSCSQSPAIAMEGNVVEKFYLLNHDDCLTSFAELRLDSSGSETSTLFLRGRLDGDHLQQTEVNAWKAEFGEKPVVFVQDLQGKWIRLGKPSGVYESTAKSIIMLLRFVNFVKQNPYASLKVVLDHLVEVCSRPASEEELLQHEDVLRKLAGQYAAVHELLSGKRKNECCESDRDSRKRLKVSNITEAPKAFVENASDKSNTFDDEQETACEEEGTKEDDDTGETKEDDSGESICSICDDGGDLLCCDGPCLRSFHGVETDFCAGLEKYLQKYSQASKDFNYEDRTRKLFCPNCSQNQHQCNSCGKLGSSQGPSQEVFLCDVALCGKFYHRRCVSILLGKKDVSAGFTCPLHTCRKCHRGEEEEAWLYQCRRCPRAWHRRCADDRIKFEEGGGVIPRGWIAGKIKFLYCMRHAIVPTLRTPSRSHLAFPRVTSQAKPPSSKPIPSNSLEPASEIKSAPVFSKADVEDRIQANIVMESEKRITPEGIAQKLKSSSTVANEICQRKRLMNLVDRLCGYVDDGDTVADLSNTFSRLMDERLKKMGKECRFDSLCWQRGDCTAIKTEELGPGNNLILIGLKPSLDMKAQTETNFVDMVIRFQPKIVILIAPRETKSDILEEYGYVLTWKDSKSDAFGDDSLVLFFWSRENWKDAHRRIALEQGHRMLASEESELCAAPDEQVVAQATRLDELVMHKTDDGQVLKKPNRVDKQIVAKTTRADVDDRLLSRANVIAERRAEAKSATTKVIEQAKQEPAVADNKQNSLKNTQGLENRASKTLNRRQRRKKKQLLLARKSQAHKKKQLLQAMNLQARTGSEGGAQNVQQSSHLPDAVQSAASVQQNAVQPSAAVQRNAVQPSAAVQRNAVQPSAAIQRNAVQPWAAVQQISLPESVQVGQNSASAGVTQQSSSALERWNPRTGTLHYNYEGAPPPRAVMVEQTTTTTTYHYSGRPPVFHPNPIYHHQSAASHQQPPVHHLHQAYHQQQQQQRPPSFPLLYRPPAPGYGRGSIPTPQQREFQRGRPLRRW